MTAADVAVPLSPLYSEGKQPKRSERQWLQRPVWPGSRARSTGSRLELSARGRHSMAAEEIIIMMMIVKMIEDDDTTAGINQERCLD